MEIVASGLFARHHDLVRKAELCSDACEACTPICQYYLPDTLAI